MNVFENGIHGTTSEHPYCVYLTTMTLYLSVCVCVCVFKKTHIGRGGIPENVHWMHDVYCCVGRNLMHLQRKTLLSVRGWVGYVWDIRTVLVGI